MKRRGFNVVCAALVSALATLFFVPVSNGALETPSETACCTDRGILGGRNMRCGGQVWSGQHG